MYPTARVPDLAAVLPSPIAWRVRDLDEPEPSLAAAFFAVEAIFRFTALMIKASYLEQSRPIPAMNALIRRHLSYPSMGAWRSFVVSVHREAPGWGWDPCLPGLANLADAIANAERVVQLRNATHGHAGGVLDKVSETETWSTLASTVYSLIEVAGVVLEPALLVVYDDQSGLWRYWRGPVESGTPTPTPVADGAPAYLILPGRVPLPLFPLFLQTFDDFTEETPGARRNVLLMFDGVDVDRKRLIYMGRHGRGHGARWFAAWRQRLSALRVPIVPFSGDEPEEDALRARFREALDVALLDSDQQYEAFLVNEGVLGQLNDALSSEARLAVIGGTAGAGKTTVACRVARTWDSAGHPTLLLRASMLSGREAVSTAIRASVEGALAAPGDPKRLLRLLSAGPRPVLIIDGVDEVGVGDRVLVFLKELLGWMEDLSAFVVLTCRSEVWRDIRRLDRERRLGLERRLTGRLYRPSVKGLSGADDVSDLIRLEALSEMVASKCWDHYRSTLPGLQPLSPWVALPEPVRRACSNPRWMMRALQRWDQVAVPSVGAWQMWRDWYEAECVSINAKRAVKELVLLQQKSGEVACRLDDWFRTVSVELESIGWQLVSSGIWVMYDDLSDADSGPLVAFSSAEVAAHAWQSVWQFKASTGSAARELAAELSGRPARALMSEAIVTRLADRPRETEGWEWVEDAEVAEALLRLDPTEPLSLLSLRPAEARSAVVVMACERALDQGRAVDFCPFAERLLGAAPHWLEGPAIWALARILRHGDRSEVGPLLRRFDGMGAPLAAWAMLAAAEHERESGRWAEAITCYNTAIDSGQLSADLTALGRASRGECWIWRREPMRAIEDLEAALAAADHDTDPFVLCNLRIKRAIAYRLCGRPVLAARELAAAELIAIRGHLAVEAAKISLEKGLTIGLIGVSDEALALVEAALAAHIRLGYLKGQKKAHYCLGWLLERAGRIDEARLAYRASLELNQRRFDRLGLALNHLALSRTDEVHLRGIHLEKASDYARKLGGLPHVDLL